MPRGIRKVMLQNELLTHSVKTVVSQSKEDLESLVMLVLGETKKKMMAKARKL
jgi:hypothetical protein